MYYFITILTVLCSRFCYGY